MSQHYLDRVVRDGCRGGKTDFSWDKVKTDPTNSYYVGTSVKGQHGHWLMGRDLLWYEKTKGECSDRSELIANSSDAEVLKKEREELQKKEKNLMGKVLVQGFSARGNSSNRNEPTAEEIKKAVALQKSGLVKEDLLNELGYSEYLKPRQPKEHKDHKVETQCKSVDYSSNEDSREYQRSGRRPHYEYRDSKEQHKYKPYNDRDSNDYYSRDRRNKRAEHVEYKDCKDLKRQHNRSSAS